MATPEPLCPVAKRKKVGSLIAPLLRHTLVIAVVGQGQLTAKQRNKVMNALLDRDRTDGPRQEGTH